jgi:hypothetical protein
MSAKVSHRFLVLWSALAAAGGCGQILGISDYEVDPKLDRHADNAGGRDGGNPNGGDMSAAGVHDRAGAPGGGQPSTDGGNGGAPIVGVGVGGAGAHTGGAANGGEGNGGAGTSGAGAAGPTEAGAAGAGGSPEIRHELVPCDSLDCCTQAGGTAEGEELLVTTTLPETPYYGDFELGTVEEGQTPWVETSLLGYSIITSATADATAHKGSYFAWLCGVKKETSVVTSEPIHVPADAGWFTLTGFRKFQIDSLPEDTVNDDSMSIGLWNETEPLELPFYWDQAAPGATAGWVKFNASWDAAPHVGEVRYLTALASTDDHVTDEDINSSNYMLDDVSLKVFRCYR